VTCLNCGSSEDVEWSYKLLLGVYALPGSLDQLQGTKQQLYACLAFDEVAEGLVGVSANDFALVHHFRPDVALILEERLHGKWCSIWYKGGDGKKDAILAGIRFIDEYQPIFTDRKRKLDRIYS
jgi:hypothetical protein